MMRSMVLEFTEDKTCGYLATQYMLGDSLLVAPIFNDQSMAEYYLPEGRWTSVLTGEEKQGGKWYKEHHGYLSIPLYARENSIVALGARNVDAVYDYADGVTLKVYALEDGKTANTVVYNTENQVELTASVTRNGNVYAIDVETGKKCRVELVNVGAPTSVISDYNVCCPDGKNVVVELPGSAEVTVVM